MPRLPSRPLHAPCVSFESPPQPSSPLRPSAGVAIPLSHHPLPGLHGVFVSGGQIIRPVSNLAERSCATVVSITGSAAGGPGYAPGCDVIAASNRWRSAYIPHKSTTTPGPASCALWPSVSCRATTHVMRRGLLAVPCDELLEQLLDPVRADPPSCFFFPAEAWIWPVCTCGTLEADCVRWWWVASGLAVNARRFCLSQASDRCRVAFLTQRTTSR